MCPHCHFNTDIVKRGFYIRASDGLKIQRFNCRNCGRDFSTQTSSFDYRLRKRRINQSVFRMLAKGMSQKGCAHVLAVDPQTIARRITRFGICAKKHLRSFTSTVSEVVFDEMETFEHTKLKPLTIPLAVEKRTRRILFVDVGKIAAKGHLAQISKKKYGFRKCERKKALNRLFRHLKRISCPHATFFSDESHHYPNQIRRYFKQVKHMTFKGRKSAIIGQGEMKKGGFDPLFCLNQTAAMIRDNIKRLTRRTWCTTKKIERLLDLLHIYSFYHNQRIDGVKRPSIFNCSVSN
jgi:transposase-like protein